MTPIEGGCRCGQLNYVLTEVPIYAGYCHCTACQRRNSAPCAAAMFTLTSTLAVNGRATRYSETGGSGSQLEHVRCPECGTIVYTVVHVLKNIVGIPAGTLKNSLDFKPIAHAFVENKEQWFNIQDNLPQYSGPPKLPQQLLDTPHKASP